MANDPIYGFPEAACKRIKTTVSRVESQYVNSPPGRRKYPVGGGGGPTPVAITSNVTAGSIAAPTSFTAKILQPAASHGMTSTGGTTITGYNLAAGVSFTASVGTPKIGFVTNSFGVYYLLTADC